jgi:hypothetical protein
MSLPVDLQALEDRVKEYGRAAFLVTVGEGGTPHVVSVVVEHDGAQLTMATGRTSRHNVGQHATVTLLWPAPPGSDYSLLVDGTAAVSEPDSEQIVVGPRSAVLHRVADAAGDGPTCRPVDSPAG